ncbi:MAG TPA: hypothetical protein VGO62_19110, partial [Myxococcota bacterium]
DFLGDAPPLAEIVRQEPSARVEVDAGSPGWYVNIPGDRLAVVAALVSGGRRVAVSNLSLAPAARPAPPGPLWLATLPPSLDRRRLGERKLMTGEVVELVRMGETDARFVDASDVEQALPGSQGAVRLPWLQAPSSSSLPLRDDGDDA